MGEEHPRQYSSATFLKWQRNIYNLCFTTNKMKPPKRLNSCGNLLNCVFVPKHQLSECHLSSNKPHQPKKGGAVHRKKDNVSTNKVFRAVSSSFHNSLSSDPADVLGMCFAKCQWQHQELAKRSWNEKLNLRELVQCSVNISAPLKVFHKVMSLGQKKPDFIKWCINLIQVSRQSISSVHWLQDRSPFNLQVSSKYNYYKLMIM